MSEPTPLVVSVEDNPADVRLIEEGVAAVDRDIDFRVYNNGRNAIEQLTGDGGVPAESVQLVLLDLNIPGKSGLEILRYLRKDSELDAVPILTVSSSENPDDIRRVYESSANAYLTKPTDRPRRIYPDDHRRSAVLDATNQ
ncbi:MULTISPECIES: response regulator [Haloarcula]|uniref:response regulator n=1 Tax=Haloarcula TaxID=2237 RepID=UPI001F49A092|nr:MULTISPECIES: response regulator [Haloarcula]